MPVTISFKITTAVTNAVAKLFIENSAGTCCNTVVTVPAANYAADSSTVTISTTWGAICQSISGLSSGCTGSSSVAASKNLKFGVDSDGSGEVEDAERKSITLKFQYISLTDTAQTQAFCAGATASGSGVCSLSFLPGDNKVYIDRALYTAGDSTSTSAGASIDWDSIAIFPVATPAGSEASAFSSFTPKQADPIFKTILTDGTIPDSQVSGNLSNYTHYCFIYGTRNKTQNIYKYVTTGISDFTKACVTPSEVVGVLEDKHCFISTAAFGSDMAPEVVTFRSFRNQFLLDNSGGKLFVHLYNTFSPPIATIIQKSEILKAVTRLFLYPLLFFAMLSLKFGLISALALSVFALAILVWIGRSINRKSRSVIILLLFIAPALRAEVIPAEKFVPHSGTEEGLVKITKDGSYIYDLKRTLKSESSRITFGMANDPNISIDIEKSDAAGKGTGQFKRYEFGDFYSATSGFIIGYSYEKFPWIDKGKLGYQIGFDAMFANGHGRLKSNPDKLSAESFTFLTLPINAGGVYRFEWKDKQILAPYVSGGGTYVVLLEKRDDKAAPSVAGGFGFYGSGGVLFNLAAIDDEAGFALDSEYGISNLWIILEFRVTEVNTESFGFSNRYVNAGLSFDF